MREGEQKGTAREDDGWAREVEGLARACPRAQAGDGRDEADPAGVQGAGSCDGGLAGFGWDGG